MGLEACREHSTSEVVFGVLKTLMVSYHLWGSSSGLERSLLSDALRTTEPSLEGALDYLTGEGLVCIDPDTGAVRLTDHGVRDLLGNSNSATSPGPAHGQHQSSHGCVLPRKVALDSTQSHACSWRRRIYRSGRGADW